ncbi:MAG: DHHA1 domain-containing protein, partial [Acidobacteriota bacterium]|nr:DHHA1 domain-containing protein [Acidobacteriota bacterium]
EATSITADRDFDEAVAAGAMALFGEKYGERVRTVQVPGLDLAAGENDGAEPGRLESLELCGGCHVGNTGEIGLFVIVAERGVASGVRRIEARTGEGAREYVGERMNLFHRVADELGVEGEQVPREVAALVARKRELESELKRLRLKLVSGAEADAEQVLVEGVRIVAREVPAAPVNEIRTMADTLRGKLGSGVVVLGSRDQSRVSVVTAVSADLTERVHAGHLAREIGALVDGKGGGRPDFAQAGGKQPAKLNAALKAVPGLVKQQLGAG